MEHIFPVQLELVLCILYNLQYGGREKDKYYLICHFPRQRKETVRHSVFQIYQSRYKFPVLVMSGHNPGL